MKCQKCGYSLPEDSEFCQYCGAHLESKLASEAVTTPAETPPPVESVSETASEAAPTEPQPEAVQEESLMSRAYRSYISTNPEEKRFFEDLLGTEELKTAYLEECERNQREYDKGVRINFKQSYTQFMGVLHDEYFGAPQASNEEPTPAAEPVAPVTAPIVEKAVVPNSNEKHNFCKKCGSAINPNTKKCSGCGKQYFNGKKTVPIVLSVLLIGSIGLNVMQYLQGQEAIETVAAQTTQIEELEKEVSTQKSTISSQKNQIATLEEKSSYFDTICKELSTGNIGYAASNFKASESVIVVDKNETNRKFTLTANWTNGGTVSTDYSGYSAWVNFDNESWTTSTKMTIEPWQEGVTAVTFSNDVDSKTFKILIIVTE
ncbi:MAG: zinc ribbon domain-containing protein [Candidatus Fimivivens sp.]|nr:zinc ribbon domain-containing protein [Candidatus Fimivivens sp.]